MRVRSAVSKVKGFVAAGVVAAGVVLPMGIAGVPPAVATFPGTNGKILYFGQVDGLYQVFAVNPDGTHRTQLTHMRHEADVPTATADGRTISFQSAGDIWVMHADGSDRRRVTSDREGFSPAISPDGTKIAFLRIRVGTPRLAVVNTDGSSERVIVRQAGQSEFAPDWSPDGTKIAFTGQPNHQGATHVYTVRPNGKDLKLVPIAFSNSTIQNAFGAEWSPDGNTFAFYAKPVKKGKPTCPDPHHKGIACEDIYTVGAAGGTPIRLTNDESSDIFPYWSPDGSQITYSHSSIAGGCVYFKCRYDVFTMRADGTHTRQLTNTPHLDEEPSWWVAD